MAFPLGGTLSIITLIEQFNNQDTLIFKKSLLNALGLNNDNDLICMLLRSTYNQLDPSVIDQLGNTARTIYSESQYPEIKPSDSLSRLTSFLPLQESIHLGYLNRNLFIKCQKE